MICYQHTLLFLVVSVTCLTSAFSTKFLIEGVDEGTKNQEDAKTQKTEENKTDQVVEKPQKVEVEVIPIVTDVFTKVEDLLNMTPLKLVTAISAQHLLTSLKTIPVSGNSYQDTLNMLERVVKEFNKTAEIIRLTAEYINISGTYILNTLNEFAKTGELKSIEDTINSVKDNFLRIITNHIVSAVKELSEKTKEREMTGSDILVSSSYHIVAAFQEMTNQVINLPIQCGENCNLPNILVTPVEERNINSTELKKNNIYEFEAIPSQGNTHRSIKKDQAVPKRDNKIVYSKPTNFNDQLTMENLKNNQDLTVEVFSPETLLKSEAFKKQNKKSEGNELKPSNNLKVEYTPVKTINLFDNLKTSEVNSPQYKEEPKQLENAGKEQATQTKDKELESSLVDSLSNIPWVSNELEMTNQDKYKSKVEKSTENPPTPNNIVNFLELMSPGYQNNPLQFQPKQKQCDEKVEPVCGIDERNNNFIIFLNDCKREAHNKLYGTDYKWFKMDACVALLLRNPPSSVSRLAANADRHDVDLRPR